MHRATWIFSILQFFSGTGVHLPAQHLTWDASMTESGRLAEAGDFQGALQILRKACAGPPDQPEKRAICLQGEGNILSLQGEDADAVRLYEQAVEEWSRCSQAEPEHSGEMATLSHNLGILYSTSGRHVLAERQLQRAVQLREKIDGAQALSTAQSLAAWGMELMAIGREQQAEQVINRTVSIFRRLAPEGSVDLAAALCQAGMMHRLQGNHDAALNLLREAERMTRGREEEDRMVRGDILIALAGAYVDSDQESRAMPLLIRAIRLYETPGRSGPIRMIAARRQLASIYLADGKYHLAEVELRHAMGEATRHFGRDTVEVALLENDLAAACLRRKVNLAETDSLLQHALSTVVALLGEEHRDAGMIHANLALLNERRGRRPEAIDHYRKASALLSDMPPELVRQFKKLRK